MALFTDKHVFAHNHFYHFTSTLDHALIFLKCVVNEDVFLNVVSLSKNNEPLNNLETWQNSECSGN